VSANQKKNSAARKAAGKRMYAIGLAPALLC